MLVRGTVDGTGRAQVILHVAHEAAAGLVSRRAILHDGVLLMANTFL